MRPELQHTRSIARTREKLGGGRMAKQRAGHARQDARYTLEGHVVSGQVGDVAPGCTNAQVSP
eukprot:189451-Rhodomonas_salina.7